MKAISEYLLQFENARYYGTTDQRSSSPGVFTNPRRWGDRSAQRPSSFHPQSPPSAPLHPPSGFQFLPPECPRAPADRAPPSPVAIPDDLPTIGPRGPRPGHPRGQPDPDAPTAASAVTSDPTDSFAGLPRLLFPFTPTLDAGIESNTAGPGRARFTCGSTLSNGKANRASGRRLCRGAPLAFTNGRFPIACGCDLRSPGRRVPSPSSFLVRPVLPASQIGTIRAATGPGAQTLLRDRHTYLAAQATKRPSLARLSSPLRWPVSFVLAPWSSSTPRNQSRTVSDITNPTRESFPPVGRILDACPLAGSARNRLELDRPISRQSYQLRIRWRFIPYHRFREGANRHRLRRLHRRCCGRSSGFKPKVTLKLPAPAQAQRPTQSLRSGCSLAHGDSQHPPLPSLNPTPYHRSARELPLPSVCVSSQFSRASGACRRLDLGRAEAPIPLPTIR